MKFLLGLLMLSAAVPLYADVIKFSDAELARESVLPVFENSKPVLNRNINTAKRFSIGADFSFVLNEAFNSPYQYGGFFTYHLNEVSGIHVIFNAWNQGNSTYADQLESTVTNIGIKYRPRPKYLFLANYQYTGYYGKISLTKSFVMNLSLYGMIGGGTVNIGGSNFPVLSLGLGQKFYLSKHLSLRLDLRSLIFNGPDVLSKSLRNNTSEEPVANFDTTVFVSNVLTMGLAYLF